MIHFLENKSVCREQLILAWFGEKTKKDCGHCDVCRDKQKTGTNTSSLEKELLQIIDSHVEISPDKLAGLFPAEMKDTVIQIIRGLVDAGELVLKNGKIKLV